MSKYAKTDQGVPLYVVSTHSWGRTSERLETANSLKEAKSQHGWTRMQHTSISVRRATVDDAQRLVQRPV